MVEHLTDLTGAMYATSEENKFIEVTYANGEKEILYFKDFASGALIEGIVSRAKKYAVKRSCPRGPRPSIGRPDPGDSRRVQRARRSA